MLTLAHLAFTPPGPPLLTPRAGSLRAAAVRLDEDDSDLRAAFARRVSADSGDEELAWWDSGDVQVIGGVAVLVAAFSLWSGSLGGGDADRQRAADTAQSNPALARCVDRAFSRREVRDCTSRYGGAG
uniref:Uncharacterized protein n=1 Tax=Emiliania huxleyi TaxID=2903 RepID=A0A7S3TYL2_EMIHU|mmetsp:Transcript_49332/g.156202  ORF Transcript_49332/g.156202 Transcript_49332/m.156202 type:complete len:128 (-) Transcript_49332:101-484(-)